MKPHFLTKTQFINKFDHNIPTFQIFLEKAKVKSVSSIVPLKTYIKDHKIPTKDIKKLYEHIFTRNEYLSRFYEKSLEPHIPLHFQETPMTIQLMNNNTNSQYKNIIRNLYHLEILKTTQSGLKNVVSYWTVLENLYCNFIIDYKILTPSARHYIHEGRIGSVFSSYYFRASIMNPFLVYSLNHRVLKGTKIFTPTLGWTSYCYGFLECPFVKEYVGVDVIPRVCKTTSEFATQFFPHVPTTIYCEPSENLAKNSAFLSKYHNYFDVVFFSPPYYRLEIYPGKNQSTTQYKSYEEWLAKYWEETIRLCAHVLQPGGKLCYIISNYGEDGTREQTLVDDMNRITIHCGFKKSRCFPMHNKAVSVNKNQDENDECICVFTR